MRLRTVWELCVCAIQVGVARDRPQSADGAAPEPAVNNSLPDDICKQQIPSYCKRSRQTAQYPNCCSLCRSGGEEFTHLPTALPNTMRHGVVGGTGLLTCPTVGTCSKIQELRGVRSNGPFALDNSVLRLRQHGTFLSFPEKECSIPPCRRRIGPCVQAAAWFETDRVSRVR